MANEVPVEEALELKRQGLADEDIVGSLQKKRYSAQQIDDAMNQLQIKEGVEENIEAPAPPPSGPGELQPSVLTPEAPAPTQPEMEAREEEAPFSMPMPSMPTARAGTTAARGGRETMEMIEELAESIVNEKWEDLMASLGNITLWKEKVQTDIRAIKQEILRVQARFDNLEKAILGRVEEYGKGVTELGSEMKALEQVMQRIISPLTENIKELNRVTKDIKARAEKKQ